MKKLFTLILFLSLLLPSSHASTVWFAITNWDGTPYTNSLKITPVSTNAVADGTYLVVGPSKWIQTINGLATNTFALGNYQIDFQGKTKAPVVFAVPQDTNFYSFYPLLISGYNTYNYTPGVIALTAGAGISLSPANGKGPVTITSTAPPTTNTALLTGTNNFNGSNSFAGALNLVSSSTLVVNSNANITFNTNSALQFNFAGTEAFFPVGGFFQAANVGSNDLAAGEFFFNAGSDIPAAHGANVVRGFELTNTVSAATGALAAAYGTAALSNAAAFLQPVKNLIDITNPFLAVANLNASSNSPIYIRATGPSPAGSFGPPPGNVGEGLLMEYSWDAANWQSMTPDGSYLYTNQIGVRDEAFFDNYNVDGYFYVPFTYQLPGLTAGSIGLVRSADFVNWQPIGSAGGIVGSIVNEGGIASPDLISGTLVRGTNLLYYTTAQGGDGTVKIRQQLDNTFTSWSSSMTVATNETAIGSSLNDAFFLVLSNTVYCFVESQNDQTYHVYTNSTAAFPTMMHLFKSYVFGNPSYIKEAADLLQMPNGAWRAYGTTNGPLGYGYLSYTESSTPFGPWSVPNLTSENPRLTFGQSNVTPLYGVKKHIALAAISKAPYFNAKLIGTPSASSLFVSNRLSSQMQTLVPSGTNITVDLSLGNVFQAVLTTNAYLLQPTNAGPGQLFTLQLQQDAVGTHLLSGDTNYWQTNAPAFDTNANHLNTILYTTDPLGYSAIFLQSSPSIAPPLSDISHAFAAYSVRKLSVAYGGKCMNVRRSSDNTTMDIGFSGTNLDTASLLTFCGAGNGFNVTWYDQSGNGRNITQSVNAKQPQIVASGVVLTGSGSKPALTFGNPTTLQSANVTVSTQLAVYCVVARPWTSTAFAAVLEAGNYGPGTGFALLVSSSAAGTWNNFDMLAVGAGFAGNPFAFGSPTNNAPNNTWLEIDSLLNATGSGVWIDSTNKTRIFNNTSVPSVTTTLNVGGNAASGDYLDGKLSELVLWTTGAGITSQSTVRSNINSYFSLY